MEIPVCEIFFIHSTRRNEKHGPLLVREGLIKYAIRCIVGNVVSIGFFSALWDSSQNILAFAATVFLILFAYSDGGMNVWLIRC